jgi:hypothetical protein
MVQKIYSAAGLFTVLSIEKVFQHLITGLLFTFEIEGIGKPDIGETIPVSDVNMALLNFAFTLLFVIGVFLFIKGNRYGKGIVFWMAFLDIVLEFLFHGIGFITLSVVVSSVIILMVIFNRKLRANGQTSEFRHLES